METFEQARFFFFKKRTRRNHPRIHGGVLKPTEMDTGFADTGAKD
jgi:hypothetical protein